MQELDMSITEELSCKHPCRAYSRAQCTDKDLYKIFSQGPVRDHAQTPKGFHQNLFKIFAQGPVQDHALQGPLRGFRQDLDKIYSQEIAKDLDQDLHARTPKRISQDRDKRTCSCWSLPQELSYKHLWDMASARSSCKDLVERISLGSPQDLL